MKNLKGLITDEEKRRFHARGLHKPIAYLNKLLQPAFILVDGLCGDLDFEEGGNPVPMHRMFSGTDPVLVDSYIAACMGYAPQEIGYIRLGAEIGVGSMALEQADIREINRDESAAVAPSSRKVKRLAAFAAPKEACSACYANLIQAFARLDEMGGLDQFAKNKVCIGQGYRGKGGTLGVGDCTADCDFHLSGCPPTTPRMLEFLRASRRR